MNIYYGRPEGECAVGQKGNLGGIAMQMRMKWTLTWIVFLALFGQAVAAEKETEAVTVNPNQVVVQVYGIV